MGILWTIIVGFVAGVIAKFLMPEIMNRPVSSSQQYSALSARLSPRTLGNRLDGIALARVPA